MRERLPTLTTFLLLIALVMGTWWAAHYTNTTVELDPPRKSTHEPDSWAKDFTMLQSNEKGVAANRLEGSFMLHYPDDDSYHLDNAIAKTYKEENPITTGTADTAIMDQGGERIQMIGNAAIQRQPNEKGELFSIKSHQLTLFPQQDKIHTTDPAVVIDGPNTLQGKGMYYDNNTRELQVLEQSHVIMSPNKQ